MTQSDITDVQLNILGAIEDLPYRYRRIIILRDVEQISPEQIAAELKISITAVQKQLNRARLCLQDRLLERL